jgi:hypothetical protein
MDREATDLRRIAGIGTAMERTLRESGVRTLADLAHRPADELAAIAGKSQRTVREWQARARELIAGKEPEPVERDRQRSETFTVEVLLNEDSTVRYVRAEHVYTQAGHARDDRAETASWSSWWSAEQELAGFLEEHAGLAADALASQPVAVEPEARPAELQVVSGEPVAPAGPVAAESAPGHRVRQLAAMPSLPGPGGLMPRANTPFTLRLPVDLAGLGLARRGRLDYQATVVAKQLGLPSRQVVVEATGTVDAGPDSGFDAVVQCEGLPAGTYRLEAAVRVDSADDHVIALLENAVMGVLPDPGRQHTSSQAVVVPLR